MQIRSGTRSTTTWPYTQWAEESVSGGGSNQASPMSSKGPSPSSDANTDLNTHTEATAESSIHPTASHHSHQRLYLRWPIWKFFFFSFRFLFGSGLGKGMEMGRGWPFMWPYSTNPMPMANSTEVGEEHISILVVLRRWHQMSRTRLQMQYWDTISHLSSIDIYIYSHIPVALTGG